MQDNTLHTLFERYIADRIHISRLRSATIRSYREVFTLFTSIIPEITTVDDLRPETVECFFVVLQSRERTIGRGSVVQGVKVSTVITYWNKLNGFFEWLRRRDLIQQNPLKLLHPPQRVELEYKELSNEHIHSLYSAVIFNAKNAFVSKRDTVIISILLFCGLRRGELLALKLDDIDFEKRLLTVRGQTSKSKRMRYIPLHPTLILHLNEYLSVRKKLRYKTPYLIASANTDTGLSTHGLKHWVNTMRTRSGVSFHLHQFRHVFATTLARKNVNIVKIQRLLGHSSLEMTGTYLKNIHSEDLHTDIQKLSF